MTITQIRSVDFFMNVGNSILAGAVAALECYEIDVPERAFVGFDEPPQDCCPELVCWLGNVRLWDGDFPDTRLTTDLKMHFGYAVDCTVRIGRCYIDVDEHGNPIDADTLSDWTSAIYADATALYVGMLHQWQAGAITELSACDLLTVGALTQYNDGGCAGHQFTITVGVF